MNRATLIALMCAGTVLMIAVAFMVGARAPSPSPASPDTRAEVGGDVPITLNLHVINADTVRWTCQGADGMKLCGPDPVPAVGVWSRKVTVLAGMTVQVISEGGVLQPSCSIADAKDQAIVHEDGECEWVAGQ